MIRYGICVAAISVSSAVLSTGAFAQTGDSLGERKASITKERGQLQAATRANPRSSVAAALLQRGEDNATAQSLVETSNHRGKGNRQFARFDQEVEGLRVHGAYAKAAFNADGELIHLIDRLADVRGSVGRTNLSDTEALRVAVANNFGANVRAPGLAKKQGRIATFEQDDFFYAAPTVERVVIARRNGALEGGFLVQNWSRVDNLLYHTLVDGAGRIVENELRTAEDSYNIYADHPGVSAQTVAQGPGAGNAQSPTGWLSGAQTSLVIQGNNVSAYLDRDANNVPDGGGVAIGDGNFLTSSNLSQQPTTLQNQEVAVQNLFYFNNLIHDTLYQHGFVESVGNFQNNNFGNGGNGNDAVRAEAQDGSGTNNANFATPADGSPGRMQMFIWTQTNPQRDGDVDSDIIWHEYGHGLTWRMIGNMSGTISGAIGEGMADVLAIIQNNNDVVGEYSFNSSNGIRSAPYTNYPRTLGDFSGTSVHFNGEIYAATIWDLKGRYSNDDQLMDDLVGGMNFTPAGPDYLDMRDGILAQVASRTGDVCPVWESFANFGMGEGASMNIRRNRLTITESFTLPSECDGTPPPPSGDATLTGLSGTSALSGRKNWIATITASVDIDNATVNVNWSNGTSTSCTTLGGSCSTSVTLRQNAFANVTATIVTINGSPVTAGAGVPTSITLNRP